MKPPEKFFVTMWETPSEAFLNYLENYGEAVLSSSIFRNSGHFCIKKSNSEAQHDIIHVTIYEEGRDMN